MMLPWSLAALLMAAPAAAQRLVPRAAVFGVPSAGWQAALAPLRADPALASALKPGPGAAAPLAAALELDGLTPETFAALKPAERAPVLAAAMEIARASAKAEARAAIDASVAKPGTPLPDETRRLGELRRRLAGYLDDDLARAANLWYGAGLSALGEEQRRKISESVKAGVSSWEERAPESAGPAVAAEPGRAADRARLLPSAASRAGAKFLKGSIYAEPFLASERAKAAATPTIVVDMDGTVAHPGRERFTIRPGIEAELKALVDAGYRLVLWTNAPQLSAARLLLQHPELEPRFDLVIGVENVQPRRAGEDFLKSLGEFERVYGANNAEVDRFIGNNGKDIALLGYRMIVDDSPRITLPMPSGPGLYYKVETWNGTAEREPAGLAKRVIDRMAGGGFPPRAP